MKTKADYNRALQVVRAIVRDWDPYSLLASGCPANEFDSEIASVVAEIPRIKSEQDAMLALSRVFSSAFEPEHFTPDECAAAGKKLFAALSNNGLMG
jgi:hypothetical protein